MFHSSARQNMPELVGITVSVISLSILLHGSSATPLLSFYQRQKIFWRRARKISANQASE
ncbi:MAG TPA: hypothetical protein VHM25_07010 [Polyangiaceae bacterium]|nr:hypothetical protein [Polyangiaceae bacterium]